MAVIRAAWFICDEYSYDVWQQEVNVLPPRKRKSWSGHSREGTGVQHS
jgi:hypothetical protein